MIPRCAVSLLALSLWLAPAAAQDLPDLGEGRALEDGVTCHEVVVPREGGETTVWIYLPTKQPQEPLPCVLIAPAGTPLIYGMVLADGDRPEHLPYVQAGFAVVAYSLAGPTSEDMTDVEFVGAVRSFVAAQGGLVDAKAALDYALAKVDRIDPARVYAAGHSSAATLALQVTAADTRIAACVAYAPCAFVPERVGAETIAQVDAAAPGCRKLLEGRSPHAQAGELTRPLFLFHAEDDANVPVDDTRRYAALVGEHNEQVEVVTVPSGGHYDAMLETGIPRAIRWLRGLK